ncbi:hypothetical protein ACA910_022101 [Epithemia clementina (nom. ined.)]
MTKSTCRYPLADDLTSMASSLYPRLRVGDVRPPRKQQLAHIPGNFEEASCDGSSSMVEEPSQLRDGGEASALKSTASDERQPMGFGLLGPSTTWRPEWLADCSDLYAIEEDVFCDDHEIVAEVLAEPCSGGEPGRKMDEDDDIVVDDSVFVHDRSQHHVGDTRRLTGRSGPKNLGPSSPFHLQCAGSSLEDGKEDDNQETGVNFTFRPPRKTYSITSQIKCSESQCNDNTRSRETPVPFERADCVSQVKAKSQEAGLLTPLRAGANDDTWTEVYEGDTYVDDENESHRVFVVKDYLSKWYSGAAVAGELTAPLDREVKTAVAPMLNNLQTPPPEEKCRIPVTLPRNSPRLEKHFGGQRPTLNSNHVALRATRDSRESLEALSCSGKTSGAENEHGAHPKYQPQKDAKQASSKSVSWVNAGTRSSDSLSTEKEPGLSRRNIMATFSFARKSPKMAPNARDKQMKILKDASSISKTEKGGKSKPFSSVEHEKFIGCEPVELKTINQALNTLPVKKPATCSSQQSPLQSIRLRDGSASTSNAISSKPLSLHLQEMVSETVPPEIRRNSQIPSILPKSSSAKQKGTEKSSQSKIAATLSSTETDSTCSLYQEEGDGDDCDDDDDDDEHTVIRVADVETASKEIQVADNDDFSPSFVALLLGSKVLDSRIDEDESKARSRTWTQKLSPDPNILLPQSSTTFDEDDNTNETCDDTYDTLERSQNAVFSNDDPTAVSDCLGEVDSHISSRTLEFTDELYESQSISSIPSSIPHQTLNHYRTNKSSDVSDCASSKKSSLVENSNRSKSSKRSLPDTKKSFDEESATTCFQAKTYGTPQNTEISSQSSIKTFLEEDESIFWSQLDWIVRPGQGRQGRTNASRQRNSAPNVQSNNYSPSELPARADEITNLDGDASAFSFQPMGTFLFWGDEMR